MTIRIERVQHLFPIIANVVAMHSAMTPDA